MASSGVLANCNQLNPLLLIKILTMAAFLLQGIEVRSVSDHFLMSKKLASRYKEECKYMIVEIKKKKKMLG